MDLAIQNIPESARVDLERWAEITIERWQWELVRRNLIYTGDLLRSFAYQIYNQADGNFIMISFAFNYYLKMMDMGVGKGVSFDETGRGSGRRKYPVYSKIIYAEFMRLIELLTAQYAAMGASSVIKEATGITGTYKI